MAHVLLALASSHSRYRNFAGVARSIISHLAVAAYVVGYVGNEVPTDAEGAPVSIILDTGHRHISYPLLPMSCRVEP